jgi:hypothetical protein
MQPLDFASLAGAFERGQAEAMVELADEALSVAGGFATFGGAGSFVNKACGVGLDGPVPEAAVADMGAFFAARGVEARVEVCPFVDASLLSALGEAGFHLREFENVLFCQLDAKSDVRAFPGPAGLQIERIDATDSEAVEAYVALSASGFFPDGQAMSEGFRRSGQKAPLLPGYDSFVARLDGRPVGAGGCATRRGRTTLVWRLGAASLSRKGRAPGAHPGAARACTDAWKHPGLHRLAPRNANGAQRGPLGFRMAFVRAILVRGQARHA